MSEENEESEMSEENEKNGESEGNEHYFLNILYSLRTNF